MKPRGEPRAAGWAQDASRLERAAPVLPTPCDAASQPCFLPALQGCARGRGGHLPGRVHPCRWGLLFNRLQQLWCAACALRRARRLMVGACAPSNACSQAAHEVGSKHPEDHKGDEDGGSLQDAQRAGGCCGSAAAAAAPERPPSSPPSLPEHRRPPPTARSVGRSAA
jgi:hypothetical protein